MGWYLRKSFRAGPVRWNLSKSGIGMSVGVRGLRVGTGPRGTYVAGGRNGLYFRQSLRRSSRASTSHPVRAHPHALPQSASVASPPAPNVPVQYIADAQLAPYTPATQHALAQHIREQRSHSAILPWVIAGVCLANLLALAFFPLLILTIPVGIYAIIQAS